MQVLFNRPIWEQIVCFELKYFSKLYCCWNCDFCKLMTSNKFSLRAELCWHVVELSMFCLKSPLKAFSCFWWTLAVGLQSMCRLSSSAPLFPYQTDHLSNKSAAVRKGEERNSCAFHVWLLLWSERNNILMQNERTCED